MTGASAACASAADQIAAVSVPRPANCHGGRLWALSVCDPCSAVMINRLSVGGTKLTCGPQHEMPAFWIKRTL